MNKLHFWNFFLYAWLQIRWNTNGFREILQYNMAAVFNPCFIFSYIIYILSRDSELIRSRHKYRKRHKYWKRHKYRKRLNLNLFTSSRKERLSLRYWFMYYKQYQLMSYYPIYNPGNSFKEFNHLIISNGWFLICSQV